MAGLLYKELVLNKKNLILMAIAVMFLSAAIFMCAFFTDDGDTTDTSLIIRSIGIMMFFYMFVIIGFITPGFFQRDEKKKWAYFISSTPLTDAGHIKSKYLFTFLIYVALLMWCYFLSLITDVLGGASAVDIAFEMLWVMLLLNAVEFPFLVRFGYKTGGYVKTALVSLLVLIAFEYILFGDASAVNDPKKIVAFLTELSDPDKLNGVTIAVMSFLPYVSAGLYFLSCKISCKLYLKGAEEYV